MERLCQRLSLASLQRLPLILLYPSRCIVVQALVQLVNSKLEAGVEPLKVGQLPKFQLALQDLRDKEELRWRHYSGLYANSSTGGCSGVVCGVGTASGSRWETAGGRVQPGISHRADVPVQPPPLRRAALQDVRNYFHADFDLLKVPMPQAGGDS